MTESALDRARKQVEQAKARLAALEARAASAERKVETRRKVILGGALIDRANRDPAAADMIKKLLDSLARPQDKKAFADWPVPGTATLQTQQNAFDEKA